jgi:prepilin signal peptidase PulO-like enzyme (type II secretory pathway)
LLPTDSVNVLLAAAAVAGAFLGLLSSLAALQLGKPFQPNSEPLIAGPVDEFSPNRFSRMHQHAGAAAVGALGFAALALVFGQSTQLVLAAIFTLALLTLALIDARFYVLPDLLTLPLLWLGLLMNTQSYFAAIANAVLGAAVGYLSLWTIYWLFKLLRNKEGLGYGDFKLTAAIGAWLGWQALPSVVLVAALTALCSAAVFVLAGRMKVEQPMPFGPFLAFAGFLTLCFGHRFTQWMSWVLS